MMQDQGYENFSAFIADLIRDDMERKNRRHREEQKERKAAETDSPKPKVA